jgi:hypothetical protein
MAFSPVYWSYGNDITATKLAQMEENARTHNHAEYDGFSAPQGGILGIRGHAAGRITGVAPSAAASTTQSFAITFPAGLFTNPPKVFAGPEASAPERRISVTGITTTGATGYLWTGTTAVASGGLSVQWIAVEDYDG